MRSKIMIRLTSFGDDGAGGSFSLVSFDSNKSKSPAEKAIYEFKGHLGRHRLNIRECDEVIQTISEISKVMTSESDPIGYLNKWKIEHLNGYFDEVAGLWCERNGNHERAVQAIEPHLNEPNLDLKIQEEIKKIEDEKAIEEGVVNCMESTLENWEFPGNPIGYLEQMVRDLDVEEPAEQILLQTINKVLESVKNYQL